MTSMTLTTGLEVFGGVDTHGQTHHAAVIDCVGRQLGDREFPATTSGYRDLLTWITSHGALAAVGVEGTGSYGAELARVLTAAGLTVVEVDRPDRKARTQVMNQIRGLLTSAPAPLREQTTGLGRAELIGVLARLRPGQDLSTPAEATKAALRRLARRHQGLDTEITELNTETTPLVQACAPELHAIHGVGPETATQLLASAGDNPERLRSEAAFAHQCGAAPIPASSGHTNRHRLNRDGDRAANSTLHTIILTRLRHDERTRTYTTRRTNQGPSKKEIIRCPKQYAAREIHHTLTTPRKTQSTQTTPAQAA
jgi:transposase